jgi:hypothetical protein
MTPGGKALFQMMGVFAELERAIQITTQDFRVQEGLRTREREAALVPRGTSRTMRSRHLTGHAVDPVTLQGGEVIGSGRTTSGRRRDAVHGA